MRQSKPAGMKPGMKPGMKCPKCGHKMKGRTCAYCSGRKK